MFLIFTRYGMQEGMHLLQWATEIMNQINITHVVQIKVKIQYMSNAERIMETPLV